MLGGRGGAPLHLVVHQRGVCPEAAAVDRRCDLGDSTRSSSTAAASACVRATIGPGGRPPHRRSSLPGRGGGPRGDAAVPAAGRRGRPTSSRAHRHGRSRVVASRVAVNSALCIIVGGTTPSRSHPCPEVEHDELAVGEPRDERIPHVEVPADAHHQEQRRPLADNADPHAGGAHPDEGGRFVDHAHAGNRTRRTFLSNCRRRSSGPLR